jgi:hypothetical protein
MTFSKTNTESNTIHIFKVEKNIRKYGKKVIRKNGCNKEKWINERMKRGTDGDRHKTHTHNTHTHERKSLE